MTNPVSQEMKTLLQARWQSLPDDLRTDWQVAGRHLVHCGYTLGAAYCSLGCTHCYLPKNANQVPIPSLEEMKAQVDANRRMIGPGGGLQITGGDVVDAYWRAGRPEELIAILRYANDAGVVPMLMTHGQVLLENPHYFTRLVREGGLRKIALHIDITQAGRSDYPIRGLQNETDLHPLRERFVDLILKVRGETGIKFHAAHTVTVTERNIESIHEILRWLIAEPRRLDAFRMVSFQTEAEVGRTQFSRSPVTPKEAWSRICQGVGIDLPEDNLWFGHPDCSRMSTLLVLFPEGRIINLIPADPESRVFWSTILRVFGGVGGHGESWYESNLRKVSIALRHPSVFWKIFRYVLSRLRREGKGGDILRHALSGRARGLNVVLHNFMSASDVEQPRDQVVEKRLAACVFRGAARRNGKWIEVPMCEMNVDYRNEIYAQQIRARNGGESEKGDGSSPQT